MSAVQDAGGQITLRRSKRRSSVLSSPAKPRAVSDSVACMKTPSTRRSKRVRFSDPGLFSPSQHEATSLTPAFRKQSLATPKQRRPATPGRPAIEGSIQFTPLTQALDERCQRRIRRNGLSEVMNNYEADKKSNAALQKELREKEAELTRLRSELEAAKQMPSVLGCQEPPPSSQQRVEEVEAEIEALRQSFSMNVDDDDNATEIASVSWGHISHVDGPSSDGGDTILIHQDDAEDSFPDSHRQPSRTTNSDAVAMGLELAAARQAKSSLLGSFRDQAVNTSFDFHFADSPARQQTQQSECVDIATFRVPNTPASFYQDVRKQLKEATSRAEEAEVALTALDIEVSALGFGAPDKDDTMAMVAAVAEHFRNARLELEKLVPGETTAGFDAPQLLPEILSKTRFLADRLKARENDLKAAKDQHRNLRGNFEKAIIAAEKANDRIKQLESTLDNNAEESLHIRMRSQKLERDVEEKEKDITSLSNALNKYRNDITRLEDLINNMQADYEGNADKVEELEARVTSETTGRRAAEVSAVQRLARINDLENQLSESRRHATDLESRLSALQSSSGADGVDISRLDREEITALNTRITNLATALATANAEVERLRTTKARLEERVRSEAEQGAKAVETLQDQLIRTVMKGNEARKKYVNGAKVRIANWELSDEREEALSSDGITMVDFEEAQTPCRRGSLVKFAEYAEVETFERDGEAEVCDRDADTEADAEQSGSESVPGSVEVHRGRGKYRKVPRLVSYDKAKRGSGLGIAPEAEQMAERKGKRKYDSGIGMDSDFEIYNDEAEQEIRGSGAGRVRNGMMTPEMSSDGDVEDREMGEVY